jgi:hypothetical protein
MKLGQVLLSALLMAVCHSVSTQTITTPAEALQAGKNFANGPQGTSAVNPALTDVNSTANVPNYTNNPPETQYYSAGKKPINGDGEQKKADCKNYVANSAYSQQECDVINYLSNLATSAPKFVIDPTTDPVIVHSKRVVGDAVADVVGNVSTCHVETKTVDATYIIKSCTQSPGVDSVSCSKVLTVECGLTPGYSNGGIIESTIHADATMTYAHDQFGGFQFNFGEVQDNIWDCHCIHVMTMTFDVKDRNQINNFVLTHARYDDYLVITLNGHDVFYGPHDPSYWEIYNCRSDFQLFDPDFGMYTPGGYEDDDPRCYPKVIYPGWGDLRKNWDETLGQDLLSYLITGTNTLTLTVISDGGGEGGIEFHTTLYKSEACTDTWQDGCAAYNGGTP